MTTRQDPGLDFRRPTAPKGMAIATLVCSVVALGWSVLMGSIIVTMSRVTYYLPPGSGGGEATRHETWMSERLWALSLPGIAVILVVVATVASVRALVHRRPLALPYLALPIGAILAATFGGLAAAAIPTLDF